MSNLPPKTSQGNAVKGRRYIVSHCPRSEANTASALPDPCACENLLAEWFGRPVILLASGRTGLHLFLRALEFNRNRHKLQVPPYLSRCVMNAVTESAFPVQAPQPADGVLFYHQYGASQCCSPRCDVVVEDIAHGFFASPDSGSRAWFGNAAIFSLPKFFGMSGLAGGLIIDPGETEERIRDTVWNSPADPSGVRAWMRTTISGDSGEMAEPLFVESAYELLLKLFRPDPRDLIGFPRSLDAIYSIGKERAERVSFFEQYFGENNKTFRSFRGSQDQTLPFALPYFGSGDPKALDRANRALEEQAIEAGIYHVDVRRNMYDPEYRPCLLIPCHQDIPMDLFESICATVRDHDATEPVAIFAEPVLAAHQV
ncbi:MAG TPA: hypothetical protein VEZ90_15945 [Blastocatellia bacterium]|nr:hypothetical protein [Blastocatellia bacterium]